MVVSQDNQPFPIDDDRTGPKVTLKVDNLLLNQLRDANIGESDLSHTVNQANTHNISKGGMSAEGQGSLMTKTVSNVGETVSQINLVSSDYAHGGLRGSEDGLTA